MTAKNAVSDVIEMAMYHKSVLATRIDLVSEGENVKLIFSRIFFRTNFNAHFNMNMYVTLSSTRFGP